MKVSGSIISPSFRGMADSERQRMIWDALHEEFGADSVQRAGAILAFTPDEWDLNEDSEDEE
jgi:acid stress-induced BolA-like protein IbaG/YrbA